MSFRRTTCPHCRGKLSPGQRIHEECVDGWQEARKAKQERAEAKRVRKVDKEKKESFKTIPVLVKEAQKEFNAYIRERDRAAGHPCISSGRALDWSGNAVDAGHYRSTGAAPHLRFSESNCHAQSKHDNQFLGGNAVDYRLGLVARIGVDAVEALESDNRVHKWTRDELIEIKETYRAKTRALRKERE